MEKINLNHLLTLEINEEHEQKGTVYINQHLNRCKCTQVSTKANFHVIRH